MTDLQKKNVHIAHIQELIILVNAQIAWINCIKFLKLMNLINSTDTEN